MMPPDLVRPEEMEPIFVLGRQHSGNTMLTTLLGNVPSVLGITGEGGFFEIRRELDRLPPEERAAQTARRIRDNGVRAVLHDSELGLDMSIWHVITPVMKEAALQGASATDLYVLGMQQVLDRLGKERWAQKATSYIFLADDILDVFPRARLIFLARNPLDLAASTARRSGSHANTLRVALSWNRGTTYALRLQAARPQNLLLLRYEDLVSDPETYVRATCDFCGLPFDSSYLDIPHVNKSDTPYNRKSDSRGLSASRTYYYREALSPVEEAAVRLAVNGTVLEKLYPELTPTGERKTVREQAQAVSLLASSATVLLAEEGKRLLDAPSRTAKRIARRFRAS